MRILLTNDDGIDAPGLAALYEALTGLGDVVTVAPMTAQSATGHGVTLHRPVAVEERPHGWAVDGRPADCVKLGLHAIFEHIDGVDDFDLVVSGMNAGANVGVNVLYSGTVGAAREANLSGVPAIACSLHLKDWDVDAAQWARAAGHARRAIDRVLAGPLDAQTLMNINVPVLDGDAEPAEGFAVVPASLSPMNIRYEPGTDDAGRTTYRRLGSMSFREDRPDTDVSELFAKRITLTPLRFDTTCPDATARWREALAAESPA